MKTNLTRDTFNPDKHYSSVRTKQGAMQLDADWNEQVDILARRESLSLTDIIGPFGVPEAGGGFRIVASAADLTPQEAADPANKLTQAPGPGDLLITAGRAYVDGKLIENPLITSMSAQPYLSGVPALEAGGLYLLSLDVWERTVTSLEDPDIREVALGGPDTATRTQRVWQVRALQVGKSGEEATCLTTFDAFDDMTAPSTGRLAARAEPDPAATGPCVVPENAGYRSLENQLYRVECVQAGTRATARFVWSRENGSVVTNWVAQNGPELTVSSPGPDAVRGFSNGDWIEIFDRGRELRGEAGILARILVVRGNVLEIDPATASDPVLLANFPDQPRIRRWDSDGSFGVNGMSWTALEQGVEIRLANGTFAVGDYWMIPARSNLGDVGWPQTSGGTPAFQPAHGIKHHHARLAMVDIDANGQAEVLDCRPVFPPLTGLMQLDYVGGDGQEAMPDLTEPKTGAVLDQPLQVAVSRGSTPVQGVPVRFAITSGGGQIEGTNVVVATTDGDGVASVKWRLGLPTQVQQVEAQMLEADATPRHVPVRFSASFSTAEQVAFDPANCPPLAQARTVQQAIDTLCKNSGGGDEPGFRIIRMLWARSGRAYLHDGPVTHNDISGGLRIICDQLVDGTTVENGRPVVFMTAHFPEGNGLLAPRRLVAATTVKENEIMWVPNKAVLKMLTEFGESQGPLELTIRGDNIRAMSEDPAAPPIWLDAEGLERPGQSILPTGDQRRGGTLVSWVRFVTDDLIEDFGFTNVRRLGDGSVAGQVIDLATKNGLSNVRVSLRATEQQTMTADDGSFVVPKVPVSGFVLSATIGQVTKTAQVRALITGGGGIFVPSDFFDIQLTNIDGISPNMRKRLVEAGLNSPLLIANLDEAELISRLDVKKTTAAKILKSVRDAARRG